jgi:hypothetical protein
MVVPPVGWVVCGGAVRGHMYGRKELPMRTTDVLASRWLSNHLTIGLAMELMMRCTNEHRCVMLALGIVRHGDVDVNARMKRVVIDFR